MFFRLLGLLSSVALVQVSCIADPWPEPDPGDNAADRSIGGDESASDNENSGNSREDGKPKKKGAEGEDIFVDSEEFQDENDKSSTKDDALSTIYCSAPGLDGLATLVGLPGALKPKDTLLVVGESGKESSVAPSTDGSFAARIAAVANEKLTLTVIRQTTEKPLGEITVGSNGNGLLLVPGLFAGLLDGTTFGGLSGSVDAGDLFDRVDAGDLFDGGLPIDIDIEISHPDTNEMVAIAGSGSLLQEYSRIIAANINLNTGRDATITCSPDCQFTLSIPGRSGDQIDLFMASTPDDRGNTEYTTVQRIKVP